MTSPTSNGSEGSGRQVFGRVAAISQNEITLWHEDRLRVYAAACETGALPRVHDLARLTLNAADQYLEVVICTQSRNPEKGDISPARRQAVWLPPRSSVQSEDILRWRKPDAMGRTRIENLQTRHRFVRAAQTWFDAHGYTEVEPPVLLPAVNPEAHLALTRAASGCWLSPSPELQMKRMLTGGFERIVSIGTVFRAREVSPRHNPEFTMIEWYHAWASLDTVLDELEDLIAAIWRHSPLNQGDGALRARGKTITMDARPWPRVPILTLMRATLGLDLRGVTEAAGLYERGYSAGLFTAEHKEERYEQLFTRLWERCEDALNFDTPVFITEWPAPLASLARLDPENPGVAKRAELMIAGMELANGFEELTDAAEQRARFIRDLETRRQMAANMSKEISGAGAINGDAEKCGRASGEKLHNENSEYSSLPVMDEKFLEALEAGLPPCAGMALGFDRLCMLFTGAEEIRQVLPFASDEL